MARLSRRPALAPPRTRRTPWQRPRRQAAAAAAGRRVSASALCLRCKRLSRTLLSAGQVAPNLDYGGLIPSVVCVEREEARNLDYGGQIP